ncbi:MipA/OmpV family protein [Aliiruegeria haliotis]|uniref:MipA/OmpV family protein n=1 Tax=Aliiruegeria haliotis TaxID=1280846 RepID=UPI0013048700|nr:MipA/OmpV family protein [Aliiruegeria haliotis]
MTYSIRILAAISLALACSTAAVAQDVPTAEAVTASSHQGPRPLSQIDPNSNFVLRYDVRLGAQTRPAYFGSDEYEVRPDFAIKFDYARLRGLGEYGSLSGNSTPSAFGLRGSLRFIGARNSDDYEDLKGLDDIDASLELGLGVVYRERNFEAFADARYGTFGHNSFFGEFGMDGIAYPTDNWELRLGPRVTWGGQGFADTYFSVDSQEALASGMDRFKADGGILGAGFEATARYRFNDLWGIEAGLRGDRMLNDAANSPITERGTEDQFRLRIGITRELILQF